MAVEREKEVSQERTTTRLIWGTGDGGDVVR